MCTINALRAGDAWATLLKQRMNSCYWSAHETKNNVKCGGLVDLGPIPKGVVGQCSCIWPSNINSVSVSLWSQKTVTNVFFSIHLWHNCSPETWSLSCWMWPTTPSFTAATPTAWMTLSWRSVSTASNPLLRLEVRCCESCDDRRVGVLMGHRLATQLQIRSSHLGNTCLQRGHYLKNNVRALAH